jgi:L-fuculose-phosphate aldolase
MTDTAARQAMIDASRRMNALGINQGTSGNISVRQGESMLITPSAMPYDAMRPEQIVEMPLTQDSGSWRGPLRPSTEWRFHLDILRTRPEFGAVVHGHATFATVLAIARKEIPACHYMIAAFGGSSVRCSPYALYGTKELSEHALAALEGRSACLLANHGMIACGETLEKAMWRAVELETIARQYYHSLLIGGPVLLSDAQIAEALAGFASYGVQEARSPDPAPTARRKPRKSA